MSIATIAIVALVVLLVASWAWFAVAVHHRLSQIVGFLALLNGRDWDREQRERGADERDYSRYSEQTKDW